MRLAFLTCEKLVGRAVDDEWMFTTLRAERSIQFESLPWNAEADWSGFDAAVVRTTWDYTERLAEFLAKLEAIEAAGCRVVNDLATIRWNSDKRYLLEMAARGVPVIPTKLAAPELKAADLAAWGEKLLIKPSVGASSKGVEIVDAAGAIAAAKRPGTWLIQPFLPHITDGELSFHFFAGAFSHAVVKVPKQGDIRVQEEHGAAITAYAPKPEELRAAQAALTGLTPTPFIARVDLVPYQGQLHLMELELIEPALYFGTDAHSPRRFVEALKRRFDTSRAI